MEASLSLEDLQELKHAFCVMSALLILIAFLKIAVVAKALILMAFKYVAFKKCHTQISKMLAFCYVDTIRRCAYSEAVCCAVVHMEYFNLLILCIFAFIALIVHWLAS